MLVSISLIASVASLWLANLTNFSCVLFVSKMRNEIWKG